MARAHRECCAGTLTVHKTLNLYKTGLEFGGQPTQLILGPCQQAKVRC